MVGRIAYSAVGVDARGRSWSKSFICSGDDSPTLAQWVAVVRELAREKGGQLRWRRGGLPWSPP